MQEKTLPKKAEEKKPNQTKVHFSKAKVKR